MSQVIVHKGRTASLGITMPYDISNDIITSQIRVGRHTSTDLIAEWAVEYQTDGTDGKLIMMLDDAVTAGIEQNVGYMDIKRISGGEPINVNADPIQVLFKAVITE